MFGQQDARFIFPYLLFRRVREHIRTGKHSILQGNRKHFNEYLDHEFIRRYCLQGFIVEQIKPTR